VGAKGRTLFVAGTARGVGKTLVARGLLERVRAVGHRAVGIAPIETGCAYGEGHDLIGRDGDALRMSSSSPLPPLVASPYRFPVDATPADAARLAGLELELEDLVSAVDAAASFGTIVVVEGPHTALTPITSRHVTLDLARALGAPVAIVGRSGTDEVEAACAERGIRVVALMGLDSTVSLEEVVRYMELHRILEAMIEALRPTSI
jgi:dethiobiotin synthetase